MQIVKPSSTGLPSTAVIENVSLRGLFSNWQMIDHKLICSWFKHAD